ncbi:MAG: haloalkane dehalogenase [Planctomycetaceae bacterium]|nr:MAG: haloalkane dehalogenase [Planctomycetaceae bacterium]
MVHGNPTWSFAWRAYIRELSTDHRVIAVDHIGWVSRTNPPGYCYRLDQHATNLVTLIDRLELKPITLCGHDWGGAIGMTAACRRPEIFPDSSSPTLPHFGQSGCHCESQCAGPPFWGAPSVSEDSICSLEPRCEWLSLPPGPGCGRPHEPVPRPLRQLGQPCGHPSFCPGHPDEPRTPQLPDAGRHRKKALPSSQPSDAATWGERDWCFTLEFLEEFQERFPPARTLSFPDAGHFLFEDAPRGPCRDPPVPDRLPPWAPHRTLRAPGLTVGRGDRWRYASYSGDGVFGEFLVHRISIRVSSSPCSRSRR